MKRTAATLLMACAKAVAADVTATWTHPTQYTDGTALLLADIQQTRLEWGTCSGTSFGTKVGETVIAGAATTATVTVAPGTYCFRAFTKAKDTESAASNLVTRTVAQPAPGAPVLTVVDTAVYSVAVDYPNLMLVRSQIVGAVPRGTACGFASIPGGFNAVPRELVAWSGKNRPTYVVARCG